MRNDRGGKKESAIFANMKAFLVNRVGDFGFALGIFALYMMTDSIRFEDIFPYAEFQKKAVPRSDSVGKLVCLEATVIKMGVPRMLEAAKVISINCLKASFAS